MEVQDLVANAAEGNAIEFENAFNTIMADKMAAAIANKYNTMFGNEEVSDTQTEEE